MFEKCTKPHIKNLSLLLQNKSYNENVKITIEQKERY